MKHTDEDQLRSHFQSLRDGERVHAPPFRAAWDGAARRAVLAPRARIATVLWLTAAAGVVLAVGVTLRQSSDRDLPPSITSWTSPTAGLLRTPGVELLGASPTLRTSILDRVVPAPVQPGGN